ncbi:MAG: hypothetical protein R3E44_11125 [Paracoccaceae bacterium]
MTSLSGFIALMAFRDSGASPEWFFSMGPIGAFGFMFFGWATLVSVFVAVDACPIIRMTPDALHVFRYPPLQWSNFKHVGVTGSMGQGFLVIAARDPDAYLALMWAPSRWWSRLNTRLVPEGTIFVARTLLASPADEVGRMIRNYAEAQAD